MKEMEKNFVVYLEDIDPDNGEVSQILPVAYVDDGHYAKIIADFLSSIDNAGDNSREYKFAKHQDNSPYPEFDIVKTIAGACLKHHDSGEGSYNKEARVIINELEKIGYKIIK